MPLDKTTIIFVPTWMCNLRCSYCDYRTKKIDTGYELKAFSETWHFGPEISWPGWLVYLNRFRPYHLELTGGEPTIYPHLEDLLAHIPCDSTWAITSNTLNNVRLFEPKNCISWTASYHYHDRGKFLDNIQWLKQRGFPLRCTLVMTPENHDHMMSVIHDFRKADVQVNVHPVLKPGFSWDKYPELITEMRALHDGVWVNFIDAIPKQWDGDYYEKCDAGGKYFSVMPDGSVIRCYSAILWHGVMGHISDFEPNSQMRPCNKPCRFPCDERANKK